MATLTVANLFIPRKGMKIPYTSADLYADWRALETWANTQWSPSPPNLFIPCKPATRLPTIEELDANWHAIENWANAIGNTL